MHTWDMWKVCLQTFRKNRICLKLFIEIYKLHGQINREFLVLRMRNFPGIDFKRIQTYREIFKSALVYLIKVCCAIYVWKG